MKFIAKLNYTEAGFFLACFRLSDNGDEAKKDYQRAWNSLRLDFFGRYAMGSAMNHAQKLAVAA